jgi:hypothetical protein
LNATDCIFINFRNEHSILYNMKYPVFIFLLVGSLCAFSQEIAKIHVDAGSTDRMDCPVSIPLDQVGFNEDQGSLQLFEVANGSEGEIQCQVETGYTAMLWFILPGKTQAGTTREFILRQTDMPGDPPAIVLMKRQGQLRLVHQAQPVLDYQFATVYPPEGVNPLYRRSGFIHPLWSPGGQVLTRIQPPDHYHHYGIWGPWTKTHISGREVDFWNLIKGEGTVRFSAFLSETEGPVYSGFRALQEHIDFGARGEDQVVMNEVLDVRVWNPGGEKIWLIDYTTTLNTPLDSGIMLDAYRYGGGVGYRATELWHKDNSSILTSEGRDRLTADGTKARWCMVEGESGVEEGRSGILFMGHPSNREFPEPMRVWPVDGNSGRGDVYFEFCPIRHNDWKLEKGKDYTLKYRFMVFDGAISPDTAEQFWHDFAHPPRVEIITKGEN